MWDAQTILNQPVYLGMTQTELNTSRENPTLPRIYALKGVKMYSQRLHLLVFLKVGSSRKHRSR